MKKKELEKKIKGSKKIVEFFEAFEKKSTVALENSVVAQLTKSIKDIEAVWAEVAAQDAILEAKKKELSLQFKQYNDLLKEAEKVKKNIDSKVKDEIKKELKKAAEPEKKTKPAKVEPKEEAQKVEASAKEAVTVEAKTKTEKKVKK